jgi:acyl dehydratase
VADHPGTSVRELADPPNLALLYPKALLTAFGRRGEGLPSTRYLRRSVSVDAGHLARYAEVCGFTAGDELPLTYPHVLAFPLAMRLMTDGDFPFALPGLVHIGNRITRSRPLRAGEPLDLKVWVENLRPHEKGRQLDVVSTASVAGEEVWTDVSTYLRRGSDGSSAGSSSGPAEPMGDPESTTEWKVADDVGRRYAAVSGDRNPIHLHPLTARLFGFPRAIAHGMWTKARCVAELESELPGACTVDVRFRAPVLLPATVRFSRWTDSDGWRFALHGASSGRSHLEGAAGAALST